MGKVTNKAYKMPQTFEMNTTLRLVDRLRVLVNGHIFVQTFVSMPFRGDEPLVKTGIGAYKIFTVWRERISKFFEKPKEPTIKLRGQREPSL